jgi:predicted GNAT family acetyltransferase
MLPGICWKEACGNQWSAFFHENWRSIQLGTLKTYRRQGIGTTLVAHTVMDSIKEGNTFHILYTEKHGNPERLYNKIGFKTDHTVVWFVKHLGKLPS